MVKAAGGTKDAPNGFRPANAGPGNRWLLKPNMEYHMKKLALNAAVLAIAAALSLSATAEEKDLAAGKIPQAVHQAFQKAYPAAKDAMYSEETKDGKATYEVKFKDNGKEIEATYSADGALVKTEEAIKASELPEAVLNAVKKAHPHAIVKEAEKVLKPDGTVAGYEAEIADGKKELEIKFDADGKMLKTEAEAEKE